MKRINNNLNDSDDDENEDDDKYENLYLDDIAIKTIKEITKNY